MWYSGASSLKYLSEVIPRGASWISSKMMSVSAGVTVWPRRSSIWEMMRLGSRSPSNSERVLGSSIKSKRMTFRYCWLANSLRSQVFPVWRAPLRKRGLRFVLDFQAISSLIAVAAYCLPTLSVSIRPFGCFHRKMCETTTFFPSENVRDNHVFSIGKCGRKLIGWAEKVVKKAPSQMSCSAVDGVQKKRAASLGNTGSQAIIW